MKKFGILLLVVIVVGALVLCGCENKKVNEESETKVVVNSIGTWANTKLNVDSKVIEKDGLPLELQYIADLGDAQGVKISLLSELYTKSNASKEEFDNLHDYSFLFADKVEDGPKTVSVKVCKTGTPLRDYFFESDDVESTIKGTTAHIFSYKDKYIVRFSVDQASYDVLTTGLSEAEMIEFVQSLIK